MPRRSRSWRDLLQVTRSSRSDAPGYALSLLPLPLRVNCFSKQRPDHLLFPPLLFITVSLHIKGCWYWEGQQARELFTSWFDSHGHLNGVVNVKKNVYINYLNRCCKNFYGRWTRCSQFASHIYMGLRAVLTIVLTMGKRQKCTIHAATVNYGTGMCV